MSNYFFIAGLPRSRTAWCANYLTYGNTFCLHDGLRDCHEASKLGFPSGFDYLGNSDPANVLIINQITDAYPDAKWVVIERNYDEARQAVKRLGIVPETMPSIQAKIEELRGRLNPMVVPFDTLNSSILDIARFVNPEWVHVQERHDMLIRMNVQVDLEMAKQELKDLGRGHLCENSKLSPLSLEYLKLTQELCSPDPFAFVWYQQVVHAALIWDHVIDKDAVSPQLFDEVMTNLVTEWPINPFLKKYGEYLMPTVVASITAWKHSYTEGASKDYAYELYAAIPAAIAFVLGGNQRVNQYMPRIREMVGKLRLEDDIRDGICL